MSEKIEVEYTEREALDEAVRMLTRRMSRLYPEAYKAVMTSLADGVREALNAADIRADKLMTIDAREGLVTRTWPTAFELIEHNG